MGKENTIWQRIINWISDDQKRTELEDQMQQADWVVVYATQSGRAQKLAQQTADKITGQGKTVVVTSLAQIKPESLVSIKRALFIVSTFGNSRAPDHAVGFSKKMKRHKPNLTELNFGLLALGNTDFDVFCAFGKSLNQWLETSNANPLFEMICVNQMAKHDLQQWDQRLTELGFKNPEHNEH